MNLIKHKAFTLAEVLVTLAIIGVVAGLTIPPLVKNYQEASYRAAFKKNFSDLNQAVKLMALDNGNTLKGLNWGNDYNITGNFITYIGMKRCNSATDGKCWHAANEWYTIEGLQRTATIAYSLFLKNGSILAQTYGWAQCTGNTSAALLNPNIDNYVCGSYFLDINGFKGPNVIGKDIYYIYAYDKNGAVGFAPVTNSTYCTGPASYSTAGVGCSGEVLKGSL